LFKFSAGVSTTIDAVAVATAFTVLYWWRQQCNQINNGCLEIFKKIITLLTVTLLFLFTFFSLILNAPRTYLVPMTHFLRRRGKTVPRAESKEKQGVWDPMPELIITSLYVHSRVDSKTLTMGNSMPESTLIIYARVDFFLQSASAVPITFSGTVTTVCIKFSIEEIARRKNGDVIKHFMNAMKQIPRWGKNRSRRL
jgi:hypothetical protein